jgi:hypothetical protein
MVSCLAGITTGISAFTRNLFRIAVLPPNFLSASGV